MLKRGAHIVQKGLDRQEDWVCITLELLEAGLSGEDVASLLRPRRAWIEEAQAMKEEGYPMDDIIHHLWALHATWEDVARALLMVELSPAEVLQNVLPYADDGEQGSVIQAALLDGPEEADYGEVRDVLRFFFLTEEEALETMDLDGIQGEIVAQRLGLSR